jgi:hypothetical protein
MIRTSSSACGQSHSPRMPVTADQPSSGGAAPAMPPITMFCGVARLR